MDVREVKEKQEILRKSIQDLVDTFESETECYVSFLSIDKLGKFSGTHTNFIKVAVFVGANYEL